MRIAILFHDVRTIYMRIDLRRGDIGMSEHLLDDAKVSSAHEHMGREGMAKGMWMKAFDPHAAPRALYDDVEALARKATTSCVQEDRLDV